MLLAARAMAVRRAAAGGPLVGGAVPGGARPPAAFGVVAALGARGFAKKGKKRVKIRLVSEAGTGYFYTTTKNPTSSPQKLQLMKHDPIVNQHVLFTEKKVRAQTRARASVARKRVGGATRRDSRASRRARCGVRALTLFRCFADAIIKRNRQVGIGACTSGAALRSRHFYDFKFQLGAGGDLVGRGACEHLRMAARAVPLEGVVVRLAVRAHSLPAGRRAALAGVRAAARAS